MILDRLGNRQRDISTRNPTHARRANRLREEARRHHGPFGPLVVLHEKRRPDDGPAEAAGLGARPRRRQRLLGDDLDDDVGGEARPEDRRGEVRGEEVAARGQVDEVLDGAAALDAGEEVHRGEEFVRAGQVEEDGVDPMAGELGFQPAGVLDGALNDGNFIRGGDGGCESAGVAGGEDECFHGVGLDE